MYKRNVNFKLQMQIGKTHKSGPSLDGRVLSNMTKEIPTSAQKSDRQKGDMPVGFQDWWRDSYWSSSSSVVAAGRMNFSWQTSGFKIDQEVIKPRSARIQLQVHSRGEESRPATPLSVGFGFWTGNSFAGRVCCWGSRTDNSFAGQVLVL